MARLNDSIDYLLQIVATFPDPEDEIRKQHEEDLEKELDALAHLQQAATVVSPESAVPKPLSPQLNRPKIVYFAPLPEPPQQPPASFPDTASSKPNEDLDIHVSPPSMAEPRFQRNEAEPTPFFEPRSEPEAQGPLSLPARRD